MTVKSDFSLANEARCLDFGHGVNGWEPPIWGLALAGETGKLCNLLKKQVRGDEVSDKELQDEIADVFTYLDLLCTRLGFNLGECVGRKFNEVSDRLNSKVKIQGVTQLSLSPVMRRFCEEKLIKASARPTRQLQSDFQEVSKALETALQEVMPAKELKMDAVEVSKNAVVREIELRRDCTIATDKLRYFVEEVLAGSYEKEEVRGSYEKEEVRGSYEKEEVRGSSDCQ